MSILVTIGWAVGCAIFVGLSALALYGVRLRRIKEAEHYVEQRKREFAERSRDGGDRHAR